MDRSLLWGAFVLGWAGWLFALLLPRSRSRSTSGPPLTPYLLAAAGVAVLLFLVTAPTRPPFAEGHGLGIGFALGAAGAILSALALGRHAAVAAEEQEPLLRAAATSAPWFMALAAGSGTVLLFAQDRVDIQMSAAIGWLCASILVVVPLLLHPLATDASRQSAAQMLAGVFFAVTLFSATALAGYRDVHAGDLRWNSAGLTLAAAVPCVLLLTALPARLFARLALKLPLAGYAAALAGRVAPGEAERERAGRGWRMVLAAALMLVVAWAVAVKRIGDMHLLQCAAAGIAAALICQWIAAQQAVAGRLPLAGAALATLVALAAMMTSFSLMGGYGIATALIGALLCTGFAEVNGEERPSAAPLQGVIGFGVLFLLYRVVETRYTSDLRGVPLSDHYALTGLIVGLSLPALAAGLLARGGSGPGRTLSQAGSAAVLLLMVPAVLVALWGPKTLPLFLMGLALGLAPLFAARDEADEAAGTARMLAILLAIGAGLAVAQWLGHLMPLASLKRAQKVRLLEWTLGVSIAAMLIGDYAGRWMERRALPRDEAHVADGAAR